MDLPLWPPAVAVCIGLVGYAVMVIYSNHVDRLDREEEERERQGLPPRA